MKPGIYNIFKPAGPTSHDIVDYIRKISGEKRVGHAGTLDPFAEGVLIVAIGREYTKRLGQFLKKDKTYRAVIRLGALSDTYDLTGQVKLFADALRPSRQEILDALKKFRGKIKQIPPVFSAIKIKGRKAYELARLGSPVTPATRYVTIFSLKLLRYRAPRLEVETKVSSGTYIRSLAHDLGQCLKTGGYLEKLIRIKVGKYEAKKSLRLNYPQST